MKDLSKVFLITDVDGTLLNDKHEISRKNLEAIRNFTEMGGHFTLATGRALDVAEVVVNQLGLKVPVVLYNGASIYDFGIRKQVWSSRLKLHTIEYIRKLIKEFPSCGVEVLRDDGVYLLTTNPREEEHLKMGEVNPIRCSIDTVPHDNWLKTLIVDEPDTVDKIMEFLNSDNTTDIHWVRSAPYYYEMLPQNTNKGNTMLKLLEMYNYVDMFKVGVGDFMNDLELIQYADLGVAVGNAEPVVKQAAKLIVSDNNHHAIHEVIEYIKRLEV